jgi:hypothetical protein
MFGLPLEIITLLFSTILGGVMSIWGQSLHASAERTKMQISAMAEQGKQANLVRQHGMKDKHFAWTRRIIALTAVFSIILLPKIAALIYIGTPWVVTVGYLELQGGFWNWLFGPEEVVEWKSFTGFVITPLDTNLVAAITGLYFGAGFSKR